ncbi:MAG: hypothetical protein GC137_09280 [Alphaproteobacteria bacterium]|nr:hypothetical protein [Alphaproteobacteria bacterium]
MTKPDEPKKGPALDEYTPLTDEEQLSRLRIGLISGRFGDAAIDPKYASILLGALHDQGEDTTHTAGLHVAPGVYEASDEGSIQTQFIERARNSGSSTVPEDVLDQLRAAVADHTL